MSEQLTLFELELRRKLRLHETDLANLEATAGKQLADLYELARKETLEGFMNKWGHMEKYQLNQVEATLQEIGRILQPYEEQAVSLRQATIDEGWEVGQRLVYGMLAVDPGAAVQVAGLQLRLGLIDRPMVSHLFGNIPQLAGKVTQDLQERIRNQLVIGAVRGESIPVIAKRIAGTGLTQEGLRRPFESVRKRAILIARTEVIKASDAGYEDLATQAQAVLQEELYDLWLTAGDERVEPECRDIGAGKSTAYPGVEGYPGVYKRGEGPRPVISTHPGCRCRRVPVLLRWLKEGLVRLPALKEAS